MATRGVDSPMKIDMTCPNCRLTLWGVLDVYGCNSPIQGGFYCPQCMKHYLIEGQMIVKELTSWNKKEQSS